MGEGFFLLYLAGGLLGTFGGYFRNRERQLSSTLAYNRYQQHYVLGAVYSRVDNITDGQVYAISQLADIPSVAHDFVFFLHEKYQIASDRPGSGNTKNIGSTTYLERLINGTGLFAQLGIAIFDDYWMHYHTRDMARQAELAQAPYHNLITYQAYKQPILEPMGMLEPVAKRQN
ncbi:MAG: type II restriction endonuclease [Phototrophicaceae bacterium]